MYNGKAVLTLGKFLIVGIFVLLFVVTAPPTSAQSTCTWCSLDFNCEPSENGTENHCIITTHCFPDPDGNEVCKQLCNNGTDLCEETPTMMSMSGQLVVTESHQLASVEMNGADGALRHRCSGAIVRVAAFLDSPGTFSGWDVVAAAD